MTTVSLTMIVRDEAAMLPGCLASVRGVVDEIVVVDTGSRDATRDLARAEGARVIEQPWQDDFSAPRNAGIAASTSDWILVLDADERLTEAGGKALRNALASADFDCGLLPLHNASRIDAPFDAVIDGRERLADVAYLPRLLRRTADLRYSGIIHENVGEWLAMGRRHAFLRGVDIVHLGGVPDVRQARDKYRRNVRLLEAACSRAPEDPTLWGYLAYEHQDAGERVEARAAADQGWRALLAGATVSDLSLLRLATARAWLEVQADEAPSALATLDRAGSAIASHPDVLFIRGCIAELDALRATTRAARQAAVAEAGRHARAARDCHDRFHLQRFIHGSAGWAADVRLGTAALLDGRASEALRHFDAALAENGAALEARWGRVEALLVAGEARAALHEVRPTLDERPDGWVLAAIAAGLAGSVDAMANWIARAQASLGAGFLAPHRRERYYDALGTLGLTLGRVVEVPGPLGRLASLASGGGSAVEAPVRGLEDPLTRRLVALLVRTWLTTDPPRVERLVGDVAEQSLPGLLTLVDEVVREVERGHGGGAGR